MRGAVIFDMDGTLTRCNLDFDTIREETGVTGPILEAMDQLDAARRQEVESILSRHEIEAAQAVDLRHGARETLEAVRDMGYATAILTRNSRQCASIVIERFDLRVDCVRTREDGAIKPSPVPVTRLLRQLGAAAEASFMVGDYLFDIQSGNAAGVCSVLITDRTARPDYADLADVVIHDLGDLVALLRV